MIQMSRKIWTDGKKPMKGNGVLLTTLDGNIILGFYQGTINIKTKVEFGNNEEQEVYVLSKDYNKKINLKWLYNIHFHKKSPILNDFHMVRKNVVAAGIIVCLRRYQND